MSAPLRRPAPVLLVSPAPWLAPEPEAEDAQGQTGGTGVPHNETNCPLPRNATWNDNTLLTIAEKISLIQEYQRERDGDPRGLTASGLAAFIKNIGVKLASRQGFRSYHFLRGTPFKTDESGLMFVLREDQ